MLGDEDFRQNLMYLIDNFEEFSKLDYYQAFIEMTERFLNELASTLNYERVICEKFGDEEGENIIAQTAKSDLNLNRVDELAKFDPDYRSRIITMLDFLQEKYLMFGIPNNYDDGSLGDPNAPNVDA